MVNEDQGFSKNVNDVRGMLRMVKLDQGWSWIVNDTKERSWLKRSRMVNDCE